MNVGLNIRQKVEEDWHNEKLLSQGGIMIGTFDLNFEKILIKELAEEIYESITSMADSRCLEKDFVFQEVIKELKVIAREDGIL